MTIEIFIHDKDVRDDDLVMMVQQLGKLLVIEG